MKRLAAVITALSLMLGFQVALADGYEHGEYREYGYGGHHYRHHYRHHYGRYYGYHHGHHDSYGGEYLIGGLALGALFTSAYYNSPRYLDGGYYESRRVVNLPPDRIVYRSVITPEAVSGRTLLKDRQGRCWEKNVSSRGDELRTELPAAECDW